MIPSNKIKIKDVAEIAGVSVGTVDRVMHNRGEVAEETKEKVLNAIKKLHYTPNVIARSLALKKKFRLTVLLPESQNQNDYWQGPRLGVKRAAEELQTYKFDIDINYFLQSNPKSFEEKALELIESNPDGIIFPPLFEEISYRLIEKCRNMEIPFSLIDSNLENNEKISFIGQNSFQSGFLVGKLMNRLVGLKNGKIVAMLIGEGIKNANQVNRRMEGFFHYFKTCACLSDKRLEVFWADQKKENVEDSLNQYLKANEVVGVFIPNSRAYLFCDLANSDLIKDTCIIGYDLLEKNIYYLEQEKIDFLIAQNPVKQGYRAVMDLFEHLTLKKEVKKESFIPIDIIMKENYKFYLNSDWI